ncbi:MAG: regulatory protein RecX [Deltaproteobacteria bacterium]|nr:regulatory protein RecX [Deltaproteobacteria bacterium]
MRMLARRALSEGEIRGRLEKKGFSGGPAEAAIRRLRELGLADDPGLCGRLAVHYRETRGYGPAKIAWTLRRRGFPRELIEETVRRSCSPEEEIEAAAAALRKKFRGGLPPGREGAARAYRFLAGRGFSPDACRRAVGRIPKDIQEGEDPNP